MKHPANLLNFYQEEGSFSLKSPAGVFREDNGLTINSESQKNVMQGHDNAIAYCEGAYSEFAFQTESVTLSTPVKGTIQYHINGLPFSVDSTKLLLINGGVPFSMTSKNDNVETLMVFFKKNLVNEVFASINIKYKKDELDHLDINKHRCDAQFFDKNILVKRESTNCVLRKIFYNVIELGYSIDEACYEIAELIALNFEFDRVKSLPFLKASTKKEIQKHLRRAKQYIKDHFNENISLDTLAQVACISRYRLLRLFKLMYGKTPHQFLIEQRIAQSRALLLETNNSVHDVAHQVGFKSQSVFTKRFKAVTGESPTRTRNQAVL